MAVLDEIIDEVDRSDEIEEIDDYLLNLSLPKEYTGKKGQEVSYVRKYEEMSLALSKYVGRDSKKMTVMEYYNAFRSMKKEFKQRNKKHK